MQRRVVALAKERNIEEDPAYQFMLAEAITALRMEFGDEIAKWIITPEEGTND